MARTDFENKLKKMGENIDELIQKVGDETKETVEELKERWQGLKTRLDEMGDKSEDTWNERSEDFEKDMKGIEDEYEIVRVKVAESGTNA